MEMLHKLLQDSVQSALNPIGTATVTQKGNSLIALSARRGSSTLWIVDSGASDHMTRDVTLLSTYSLCTGNTTVKIADGTSSKVTGIGSVVISKDVILKSILFVPNLDCNLLSISKLTKDLNCVAKFFPNLCKFQVLGSRRTIGIARLFASLYLLRVDQIERQNQKISCVASIASGHKDSEILCWQYRLVHLNFLYLRKNASSINQ